MNEVVELSAHVRIPGRFPASAISRMLMRSMSFRYINSLDFFVPDINHSAAAGGAYTWETNIRHH